MRYVTFNFNNLLESQPYRRLCIERNENLLGVKCTVISDLAIFDSFDVPFAREMYARQWYPHATDELRCYLGDIFEGKVLYLDSDILLTEKDSIEIKVSKEFLLGFGTELMLFSGSSTSEVDFLKKRYLSKPYHKDDFEVSKGLFSHRAWCFKHIHVPSKALSWVGIKKVRLNVTETSNEVIIASDFSLGIKFSIPKGVPADILEAILKMWDLNA